MTKSEGPRDAARCRAERTAKALGTGPNGSDQEAGESDQEAGESELEAGGLDAEQQGKAGGVRCGAQ